MKKRHKKIADAPNAWSGLFTGLQLVRPCWQSCKKESPRLRAFADRYFLWGSCGFCVTVHERRSLPQAERKGNHYQSVYRLPFEFAGRKAHPLGCLERSLFKIAIRCCADNFAVTGLAGGIHHKTHLDGTLDIHASGFDGVFGNNTPGNTRALVQRVALIRTETTHGAGLRPGGRRRCQCLRPWRGRLLFGQGDIVLFGADFFYIRFWFHRLLRLNFLLFWCWRRRRRRRFSCRLWWWQAGGRGKFGKRYTVHSFRGIGRFSSQKQQTAQQQRVHTQGKKQGCATSGYLHGRLPSFFCEAAGTSAVLPPVLSSKSGTDVVTSPTSLMPAPRTRSITCMTMP